MFRTIRFQKRLVETLTCFEEYAGVITLWPLRGCNVVSLEIGPEWAMTEPQTS